MSTSRENIDLRRRYFVFGYDQYYPGGGLSDVSGTFDTEAEALAYAKSGGGGYDFVSIWDRESGEWLTTEIA